MTKFMLPEYTDALFIRADLSNGDEEFLHVDSFGPGDVSKELRKHYAGNDLEVVCIAPIEGKWWCRLSAPGYLDATDWSGPFDTLKEAKKEIEDNFEIDPDTGEDLYDEEEYLKETKEKCY